MKINLKFNMKNYLKFSSILVVGGLWSRVQYGRKGSPPSLGWVCAGVPILYYKSFANTLSDVVQRRMGLHWKFIQVVAVHQNPLAGIFLSFGWIFARFRAFFCVLVGFCTFLRVFICFSALGALLGALGTLLGVLGTLLGRSWDALGCS